MTTSSKLPVPGWVVYGQRQQARREWQAPLVLSPKLMRRVHQSWLLEIVRKGGPMTPADLAKFESGLCPATLKVSNTSLTALHP